jgi:hypothetical protein
MTLLGCEPCGFDLSRAEIAGYVRLTDAGDNVIVDRRKPNQDVIGA